MNAWYRPLTMWIVWLLAGYTGCGGPGGEAGKPAAPPAKVETHKVSESDLATITLTPESKARLGIRTAPVEFKPAARVHTVAGEVTVPPGKAVIVASPVAGTVMAEGTWLPAGSRVSKGQKLLGIVPLLPVQRDLRVNAEAEVSAAATRVEAARVRADRARQLLQDKVGSVRAQQDAAEALRLAETELEAARARLKQIQEAPVQSDVEVSVRAPQDGVLRQFSVAPGQMVSSGAPLFEVAGLDPVWVRAPVYSGDVNSLRRGASAVVRPLNAGPGVAGRAARAVQAPPSADPLASTTDLFYELPNPGLDLQPGEKVSVSLPVQGEEKCLQVPWPSILYDIHGGAWVYQQTGPSAYTRHRVMVDRVAGGIACLTEGPGPGAQVVTDGAAELFGTEFGAGK